MGLKVCLSAAVFAHVIAYLMKRLLRFFFPANALSPVTTFMSGATFELSFRLAYAHRVSESVYLVLVNVE